MTWQPTSPAPSADAILRTMDQAPGEPAAGYITPQDMKDALSGILSQLEQYKAAHAGGGLPEAFGTWSPWFGPYARPFVPLAETPGESTGYWLRQGSLVHVMGYCERDSNAALANAYLGVGPLPFRAMSLMDQAMTISWVSESLATGPWYANIEKGYPDFIRLYGNIDASASDGTHWTNPMRLQDLHDYAAVTVGGVYRTDDPWPGDGDQGAKP